MCTPLRAVDYIVLEIYHSTVETIYGGSGQI